MKELELLDRCPQFPKVQQVSSCKVPYSQAREGRQEAPVALAAWGMTASSKQCCFPDPKEGHCQLVCPSQLFEQRSPITT